MRRALVFLGALAAGFAVPCGAVEVARPEFACAPAGGQVHASTLLPLKDGGALVAWFQGSREGARDVAIWGAVRAAGGRWESPRLLADASSELPHWNPVLRRADDGRIELYFKVGANCADWRTFVAVSTDEGRTFSAPRELVAGDATGGRGPVRNKCLKLKSGRWLAPASRETDGRWRAFVDRSDDDGRTWTASAELANPEGVGVIQPTLWQSADGTVHAYLRSNAGRIYAADSTDDGASWSATRPTELPNNNSGIDLVKASDGKLYLAMNPVSGNWASRAVLDVMVSDDDGRNWTRFCRLAGTEAATQGSWGGVTNPGEDYSYPAIVELKPGQLAVSYTHCRSRIAFQLLPTARKDAVVIIPAHPDDLSAAVGFCLLSNGKYDIHVIDFTHGERGCGYEKFTNGWTKATRTREEEAVCAAVGAKLHWLDEVDGEAYACRETCHKLAELLKEIAPRAIIAHWPVDVHTDHVMAGAAALRAAFLSGLRPEIYFFEQPYQGKRFAPDITLDITPVAKRKLEIIRLWKCQNGNDGLVRHYGAADEYRGLNSANFYVGRAEAFVSFYPLMQGMRTVFSELPGPALSTLPSQEGAVEDK